MIKRTILFTIFALYSSLTFASGFQLGAGGLTPHYAVGPGDHNYCNQIQESNVIYNREYYARVEGRRDALTYLIGYDSICSPIQGVFYTYKAYEGKWFGFGITGGGYRFNMANWITEEQTTPVGKHSVTPVYTKIGNSIYIVPVLGAEFNLALVHAGPFGIWLNTIVTPIIANVSLSLKYSY